MKRVQIYARLSGASALILACTLLLTFATTSFAARAPFDGSSAQLAEFAAAYERIRANGGQGTPAELEDVGYFKGFVMGIFQSHSWPCAPPAVPMGQAWAIVAKYIRENPERWEVGPANLVAEALVHVWGCKAK